MDQYRFYAGGIGASGTTIPYAEVFHPTPLPGTWTSTRQLSTAREEHTATLLPNGLVFVTGGYNSSLLILGTSEMYNPVLGEWTWTCSLNQARYAHTATGWTNGSILFAGGTGQNGYGVYLTELYTYP
jgi:hypothetical protein